MKNLRILTLAVSLLTLALFSCNNTRAQATYTANSSKTTVNLFKGAVVADSMTRLPIHDTIMPSWYASRYQEGSVVYRNADSTVYYHNGNRWFKATRESFTASAALDFPSTLTLASADLTISVPGAAVGDCVILGAAPYADNRVCYTAFVSATDVVKVRFNNYSNATVDPASATYKVTVIK